MMRPGPRIRRARPREAVALSGLAMRSKAHWGYDAAFMAACRAELTLTPADLARSPVFVCQSGRRIAGFYRLDIADRDAEIGHFFVAPAHIGRGIGRRLWRHLVRQAKRRGVARIAIASDPSAAAFYTRMGARRFGSVASESVANRRLPALAYDLATPYLAGRRR
jgi:GNAT superfamily N-acetyltransferase